MECEIIIIRVKRFCFLYGNVRFLRFLNVKDKLRHYLNMYFINAFQSYQFLTLVNGLCFILQWACRLVFSQHLDLMESYVQPLLDHATRLLSASVHSLSRLALIDVQDWNIKEPEKDVYCQGVHAVSVVCVINISKHLRDKTLTIVVQIWWKPPNNISAFFFW